LPSDEGLEFGHVVVEALPLIWFFRRSGPASKVDAVQGDRGEDLQGDRGEDLHVGEDREGVDEPPPGMQVPGALCFGPGRTILHAEVLFL